jgi:hypothetical protein
MHRLVLGKWSWWVWSLACVDLGMEGMRCRCFLRGYGYVGKMLSLLACYTDFALVLDDAGEEWFGVDIYIYSGVRV